MDDELRGSDRRQSFEDDRRGQASSRNDRRGGRDDGFRGRQDWSPRRQRSRSPRRRQRSPRRRSRSPRRRSRSPRQRSPRRRSRSPINRGRARSRSPPQYRGEYGRATTSTSTLASLLRTGDVSLEDARAPERLADDISFIARRLVPQDDVEADELANFVIRCVSLAGGKAASYATFTGVVSGRSRPFQTTVLKNLREALESALHSGDPGKIQRLVWFAASLVGCKVAVSDDLAAVLESAQDQLRAAGPEQSDGACQLLLQVLIRAVPAFATETEVLERAAASAGEHMAARKAQQRSSAIYMDEAGVGDALDELWSVVTELKEKGWVMDCGPTPWTHLSKMADNEPTRIGTMDWDATHTAVGERRGWLDVTASASHRCFVHDGVSDIIATYSDDLSLAADQIIRLTANVPKGELFALEVIYAQLVLPTSPLPVLAYSVLISHLCSKSPDTFPSALAFIISNKIFDRLDRVRPIVRTRVAEQLSLHLSATDYNWLWSEWEAVMAKPEDDLQRVFVGDVVRRCVQLSYVDRIGRALTKYGGSNLLPLLPPPPTTAWQFKEDSGATTLLSHLSGTSRTSETQLREHIEQAQTEETLPSGTAFAPMLLSTIVEAGHTSHSHKVGLLEQYHGVLQSYLNTEEAQKSALACLVAFYKSSLHQLVLLIDHIASLQLIPAATVLSWLFTKETFENDLSELPVYCVWELTDVSLAKILTRIGIMRSDMENTMDDEDLRGRIQTKLEQETTLLEECLGDMCRCTLSLSTILTPSAHGLHCAGLASVLAKHATLLGSSLTAALDIVQASDVDARIAPLFSGLSAE